jgi:hypothetical protein
MGEVQCPFLFSSHSTSIHRETVPPGRAADWKVYSVFLSEVINLQQLGWAVATFVAALCKELRNADQLRHVTERRTASVLLRKLQVTWGVTLLVNYTWPLFTLFIPHNVTRLLQCTNKHTHTCYNLISQTIFYRFRASKVHHQEADSKITGIMV